MIAADEVLTELPTGQTVFANDNEDVGEIIRGVGATASFTGANITASVPLDGSNGGGIIGAWATTGSGANTRYATLSGGTVVGYTGATSAPFNWTSSNPATENYEISGVSSAIGVARSANTVRYVGGAGTQTYGNGGDQVNLTVNGIMNAGSGTLTLVQGGSNGSSGIRVGTANNRELVLHAANANLTIGRIIESTGGTSSVTIVGPHTVTFTANNTFTGTLTVANGASLAFNGMGELNNTVVGAGNITTVGASSVAIAGDFSGFTGTFTHNSTTVSTSFNSATATSKHATYHLASTQGSSQGFVVAGGGNYTLEIGALSGVSGSLFRGGNSATGTTTLQIGHLNTSTTFAGSINNGVTKVIALNKVGSASLTLSGNNNFSGGTTVSAGSLIGNGAFTNAANSVTVAAGGTLGGSGSIAGATTVYGTLAAGNSPGILTFTSDLSLEVGSVSEFEIGGLVRGTEHDGVDVGGTLTYGGTLSLLFNSSLEAGIYDLFGGGFSTTSGTFSDVSFGGSFAEALIGSANITGSGWTALSANWAYAFDNASGDLTISAIPEPASVAALLGLAAVGFAGSRRRRQVRA